MLNLLLFSISIAQEPEPYEKRTFVIAASEKSFSQAMLKATSLSEQTGFRFDMRGVGFDPKHVEGHGGGLTFTKSECEESNWGYPCYVARGRWDSGTYISVEHTSAIQGFTPGLYVVIASTGTNKEIAPALKHVQKFIPDAYSKSTKVYIGCMQ